MKKFGLTILIVFVFGLANAQTKKESSYGVKGGLNIATWIGNVGNVSSKIGINFGIFTAIKISNRFSIQPELIYSSQGIKFNSITVKIGGVDYSAEGKINLSYLDLPIMAKYYVFEKISLDFGPQLGFLTTAKTEGTLNGNSLSQDIKDNFKALDFGLNLGTEYVFSKNISAGVRYNFGLINIAKTQQGENSKARNSILSLSLGYKF